MVQDIFNCFRYQIVFHKTGHQTVFDGSIFITISVAYNVA